MTHGAPASLAEAGRVIPALPEDVAAVVGRIERTYQAHPGYRHAFWDFMATGEYDLAFLRRFALLYYEHVRVFRLYLAGCMTAVPIEEFQVVLSQIIADEFGVRLHGEPQVDGHPELFRRFMRSIGLTEADWEAVSTGKNLVDGLAQFKQVHYALFNGGLGPEMCGAVVFGMERTTPHRHSRMIDGLQRFADRTKMDIDWQFFSEHVGVDCYHNTALISALAPWFRDPVAVSRMEQGARLSFDARQRMLDSISRELGVTEDR